MRKKKGFTLIELLVVITIIGILASLAIPAMLGVMERTYQTKDVNNARQIGMILFTKASEEDGVYPDKNTGGVDGGLANSSSDVFTALLKDGYLNDTKIFAAHGVNPGKDSDGDYSDFTLLASNNGWDYVSGLKMTSSTNMPLVLSKGTPYNPKSTSISLKGVAPEDSVWGDKGIAVYTVGQSSQFLRAKGSDKKVDFGVLTKSNKIEVLKP